MARRSARGFINVKSVLEQLEKGRGGAIEVRTQAKINSSIYEAAGGVTAAIDELAEELTGDRTYFHLKGHSNRAGHIGSGQSE